MNFKNLSAYSTSELCKKILLCWNNSELDGEAIFFFQPYAKFIELLSSVELLL